MPRAHDVSDEAADLLIALPRSFACFAGLPYFRANDANLDAQNNLVFGECYVANPPPQDVEIIFAQVLAHMSDET